jgi:endoglucanase Acf2
VNAYYGALLWASVALPPAYVQYAQLLLASEQQAARVYWHLYPQQSATDPNNPYPEASVRALTTMGNVQDWQTGAFLWWGSQKSEIAAIQMLPVTPVNELLYDAQWVQNVWQYTASEFADPTIADSWFVVLDIMVFARTNVPSSQEIDHYRSVLERQSADGRCVEHEPHRLGDWEHVHERALLHQHSSEPKRGSDL